MIADSGPMPSSSVGELGMERLHCGSASVGPFRLAFDRASSAPGCVVCQAMDSTLSTTTGEEEVIIEDCEVEHNHGWQRVLEPVAESN